MASSPRRVGQAGTMHIRVETFFWWLVEPGWWLMLSTVRKFIPTPPDEPRRQPRRPLCQSVIREAQHFTSTAVLFCCMSCACLEVNFPSQDCADDKNRGSTESTELTAFWGWAEETCSWSLSPGRCANSSSNTWVENWRNFLKRKPASRWGWYRRRPSEVSPAAGKTFDIDSGKPQFLQMEFSITNQVPFRPFRPFRCSEGCKICEEVTRLRRC